MLKAFILLLTISITISVMAQNLVPNPGFEEPISCVGIPWINSLELASPWYSANFATPDLFTTDSISSCGNYIHPGVAYIYRTPYEGERFAGFYTYISLSETKEYCAAPLNGSLIAGNAYQFRMRYRVHSQYHFAVQELGALFTNGPLFLNAPGAIELEPQLIFYGDPFLGSTEEWVLLEGSFIADGGEAYLTIGSFEPNSTMEVTPVGNPNNVSAYYLIDNVELIDMGVGIAPSEGTDTGRLVWTNDGSVYWTGPETLDRVNIIDPRGRLIWSGLGSTGRVLYTGALPPGMYVVMVTLGGGHRVFRFVRE